MEHGLGAPEQAGNNDAGDGGEDDGAENSGAPGADDLLNDEENGGDGSVEGRGETGCGADGREKTQALAGHPETAGDDRGDAGTDLERWVFGAKGMSTSQGEGRGEEFSHDGFEGDVAVVDVEGGLGLVDPAAARAGEKPHDEGGDDQSHASGHENEPVLAGVRGRAEQKDLDPLDGDAEGDDQKAGEDTNEDGKDEKEAFVPGGGELLNVNGADAQAVACDVTERERGAR